MPVWFPVAGCSTASTRRYGTNEQVLADLCHTWAEEFDWRAQEAAINRLPQFRVLLDDVPIHFVHVRGIGRPGGPPPVPIVLTHGWPWTFWDYHRVIGPLADPQSLAYGLNDSPVGLAGWMLERRRAWSDCDGDVESVFPRDFLLTTFSIYWFTRSIGTSMRWYYENVAVPSERRHDRRPTMEAPTAIAVFPHDVLQVPRSLAERHANLVRWTVMPRGGHFAPSEQPDLLVDDIRATFRWCRSASSSV